MSGKLYVVATPIGNLEDITLRAINTLKRVDRVLSEDTRHTKVLLNHLGINKPLLAVHDHNEREITNKVASLLEAGENLALVSDAGTPLISDPGYHLVQSLKNKELSVVPIPGACAAIAALSASGLPSDKFFFEGFLPAKTGERIRRLEMLKAFTCTVICYESTHRLVDSLNDIAKVMAERPLVLAKELTKQFEAILSGNAMNILTWLEDDAARQKGEFVLLIAGADKTASTSDMEIDKVLSVLGRALPVKQAASIAAELTGEKKNALYQQLLKLKESKNE